MSARVLVEILTTSGKRYEGRGTTELEALHAAVGAFATASVGPCCFPEDGEPCRECLEDAAAAHDLMDDSR